MSDSLINQDDKDVVVRVENVSKRFCRSLKKSLWYGLQDMAGELKFRQSATSDPDKNANCAESIPLRKDEFWALKNVSFELRQGECLGLIGHNGAGKTTLLKALNGLIKIDTGRIEMRGQVGALIALGAGFNPLLTGRENVYINASILGLKKEEIDQKFEEILDFAEIGEFIDAPVQSYSSGMAVRLGFAIAVKILPRILLLDEVLAVGDVRFQAKCFNTLAEFRKQGVSFILVSHNMHIISRYSDRVLYLKHGQIAEYGNSEKAIEQFLIDMQPGDNSPEGGSTDWAEVHGSGKVVFKAARFLNSNGDPVQEITAGDSVTLEIDYERGTDPVENPALDLIIRNREEIVFQGSSELKSATEATLPSRGKFQVTFPTLPLNTRVLEFFFCAMDKKTSEIFDWKRHVRLNVRPNPSQQGSLVLHPSFKVAPALEKPLPGMPSPSSVR